MFSVNFLSLCILSLSLAVFDLSLAVISFVATLHSCSQAVSRSFVICPSFLSLFVFSRRYLAWLCLFPLLYHKFSVTHFLLIRISLYHFLSLLHMMSLFLLLPYIYFKSFVSLSFVVLGVHFLLKPQSNFYLPLISCSSVFLNLHLSTSFHISLNPTLS